MENEKNLDMRETIKTAVRDSNPNASPADQKKCEDMMVDVIINEKTPAEAMGLKEVDLERFYGIAYNLYQAGKYKEAGNIFDVLCHLNGIQPKYWYGRAACSQKLKKFEKAKEQYMAWSFLESDNPVPFFHASECCLQLGQKGVAIVFLQIAVKLCGDKEPYQKIKEKAKAIIGLNKKV